MKSLRKIRENIRAYVYDSSVDVRDRAFIVFSIAVLAALYAAIPCGLIMREPPMATISTVVGAVVFSVYVWDVYRKKKIQRARKVISYLLVFGFLPLMFFTNGGVGGGTPVWLLLGTLYIVIILDGRQKALMLILNSIVTLGTWILAYYVPDLVTEYDRWQNYFDTAAALFIVGWIVYFILSFQNNLVWTEEKQKNLKRLFEQTAVALVSAIDAKDEYTHGHSARVAEYSRKIAEQSGMSEEECDEIYYVALLHDVGKIGIPEAIINKEGKLTPEEYEVIKQHPVLGGQILHSISEYPKLGIGAMYHHERYDGKGYPEKLKGEDIPEIARIISVADAYDAMTSKRSYRDPIPQQSVREEIVKGAGTQFDPKYAKVMQHLIDLDTEYDMKEKEEIKELSGRDEMESETMRDYVSEGLLLTPQIRKSSFKCEPLSKAEGPAVPAMIIFDSLDGRFHDTTREMEELNYYEFAEIHFDGTYVVSGARKVQMEEWPSTRVQTTPGNQAIKTYDVEAVKSRDHVMITLDDGATVRRFIIALPDSSRYAYAGATGDNVHFYNVTMELQGEAVGPDYIPRIAELVSYLDGPEGDVPSVQVDGYRTDATEGIPITNGMRISFHTKSLPTARLVWHCAFVDIFTAENRKVNGPGYVEYSLIRLDGENWESGEGVDNKMIVSLLDDFCGWNAWKDANKEGYDCTVSIRKEGNRIVTTTENKGISIKNITTIENLTGELYVALTGDQCAITNIRIMR